MTLLDVVIVGAGMAGLACAQRLQGAGYQVSVLEKSRGLGGRMATRRIDGIPIDHGARFLQPQGQMLSDLTQQLIHQGIVTSWQPETFYLDSTGQLNPDPLAPHCYVAPAGMSAVGKALGTGLTIHRQQRVTAIAPTAESHWSITTTRADTGETGQHTAKSLVLAIPAPQIVPLLESLRSQPEIAAILPAIAAVQYAPCITVMAQYAPHASQAQAPLPCMPTTPWMMEGHADTPFFWVGLDSSKRQAPGMNIVLQSSAAFAEHWLETTDLQPAGEALLTQAGRLIAPWLSRPRRWQVHRWRYALVEKPCPQGALRTTTPSPLIACGDWCGELHIETALDAGWAAAASLQTMLGNAPLPDSPIELNLNLN